MKQVYEIDNEGYFIGIKIVEEDVKESNLIEIQPPHGLYRARWINGKWIEDMSTVEIEEFNNQPMELIPEEKIKVLEEENVSLKEEMTLTQDAVNFLLMSNM